jgi:hypothetical protein
MIIFGFGGGFGLGKQKPYVRHLQQNIISNATLRGTFIDQEMISPIKPISIRRATGPPIIAPQKSNY